MRNLTTTMATIEIYPFDHATQLLHTAQILYENSPASCDIIIECEGVRIAAHRVVVAAFSRVLAAHIITQCQPVICLDYLKVSSDALRRLVTYMYKNDNLGSCDNIQDIYKSAHILGVPSAIQYIEKYMADKNCMLHKESIEYKSEGSLGNIESQIIGEIFQCQTSLLEDNQNHQDVNGKVDSSNINDNENAGNESDSCDVPANPKTSAKPRYATRSAAKIVRDNPPSTKHELDTWTAYSENIVTDDQTKSHDEIVHVVKPIENMSPDDIKGGRKLDSKELYAQYRKDDGSYCCPHCTFSSWFEEFVPHMRQHKESERPYVCDKCPKAFKVLKHLKAHIRTHSNARPHVCNICSAAFKDQKHLTRHTRLHTGEKPYQCNECERSFVDKDRLRRHVDSMHHNRRPHACDHPGCTYRASHADGLKKHQITHLPPDQREVQICDVCGKELKGARSIKMHMLLHDGEDLKCTKCDYTTKFKNGLKSHMLRIHGLDLSGQSAPKQHMCELCGYQTHFSAEYRQHVTRMHSGGDNVDAARPYACSLCLFRTADRDTLKIHTRGHTGEAPFVCEKCPSAAYTSRSALTRHKRSVHGSGEVARPHRCPQCPAAYGERKNLVAHMYRHTGVKPFPCTLCSFEAMKKTRLHQHIRQTHGEEHLPEPRRKVNSARHRPNNNNKRQQQAQQQTQQQQQMQLPPPPPPPPQMNTHPVQQLPPISEIQALSGHKVDLETAAAAVVMQSMASGEYLQQKTDYATQIQDNTAHYQTLEQLEYIPQQIVTEEPRNSNTGMLPNMAELTNFTPVYSQPLTVNDQDIIATTSSSSVVVTRIPQLHHLHHPQQHQQQQQPQQQHQQQQQLQPSVDNSNMMVPVTSSILNCEPYTQTTEMLPKNPSGPYREGILAGAAREAGLLAGGEVREEMEGMQGGTSSGISGLDLSIQESFVPVSTNSNPNVLPLRLYQQ